MKLSPVSSYLPTGTGILENSNKNITSFDTKENSNNNLINGGNGKTSTASLSTEYYKSTNVQFTYSNADGDSFSLSVNQVEYQNAQIRVSGGDGNSEAWKKIVDDIKKQYEEFQKDIINKFMNGVNGQESSEVESTSTTQEIPDLPEYWNAENTSQRIVDFALSFRDLFEGSDDEFLEMVKGAIDDGFDSAKDEMGELPDEVGKLVDDTHSLIMKKLDDWAKERKDDNSNEDVIA